MSYTVGDVLIAVVQFVVVVIALPLAILAANDKWLHWSFVQAWWLFIAGIFAWLLLTSAGRDIWNTRVA